MPYERQTLQVKIEPCASRPHEAQALRSPSINIGYVRVAISFRHDIRCINLADGRLRLGFAGLKKL